MFVTSSNPLINEQLIKSSIKFLQAIFTENFFQLEVISDIKEISHNKNKTHCVKLCESKRYVEVFDSSTLKCDII